MSPAMHQRLQAAADHVATARRAGSSAPQIIQELIDRHRASIGQPMGTYKLRVAGVAAGCSWSADTGLLQAWERNATLKLAAANVGGFGRE